jgi:hypothetical protein
MSNPSHCRLLKIVKPIVETPEYQGFAIRLNGPEIKERLKKENMRPAQFCENMKIRKVIPFAKYKGKGRIDFPVKNSSQWSVL